MVIGVIVFGHLVSSDTRIWGLFRYGKRCWDCLTSIVTMMVMVLKLLLVNKVVVVE